MIGLKTNFQDINLLHFCFCYIFLKPKGHFWHNKPTHNGTCGWFYCNSSLKWLVVLWAALLECNVLNPILRCNENLA